jgi:uncharacterized protein (DUF302 family)/uncharacterized membrane protein YidH (DUF202 family)
MNVGAKAGLSDYFAAERTLLAWIRTALALMGFGFVVARFGLFLEEFEELRHAASPYSYGLSRWFGTALIVVGVAVSLLAAWHHIRLVRELERGEEPHPRPSAQAVAVAVVLGLVGLAMAIYLVAVPRHGISLSNDVSGGGSMTPTKTDGLVDRPSRHSVDETVEKLERSLQSKGVTLFAVIDHGGEAAKAGMKMPPTKLLIFGSPKAGTPVMLAAPSSAIDLPLKILVWQDAQEKVWITYNSTAYLGARHGVPAELLQNLGVVESLATAAGD